LPTVAYRKDAQIIITAAVLAAKKNNEARANLGADLKFALCDADPG
jgi:hypothetical protein